MPPGHQSPYPVPQGIVSALYALHDRARTLNQQSSQVLVAAFADTEQGWFAAGAVLAGN